MAEVSETKVKKQWTDEERLELCAKLDEELIDHMNTLERTPYTEGWPEDKWEEEMNKHPFFMKSNPEPGEELSPLMIGLQQLKYGEADNTPEELAANYKEDGNFNFKHKKYRVAILGYTEGIKTSCKDDNLRAQLYNNRAAAQLMLKNYRSSLNDSKHAMKLKPDYPKALSRAAVCCFNIKNYNECIELCNKYLAEHGVNGEISTLLTNANLERKKMQRDERLKEKREKLKEKHEDKLIEVIKSRGIKFELTNNNKLSTLKSLEPQVPQLTEHKVHFAQLERLIWPVLILYPETKQMDFIQNFHEDTPVLDQLEDLFEEPPSWDVEQRYILPNINVYYEGEKKQSIHKVDISQTLGTIMQQKQFVLRGGTPSFMVLIACSDAEQCFLRSYKISNCS